MSKKTLIRKLEKKMFLKSLKIEREKYEPDAKKGERL